MLGFWGSGLATIAWFAGFALFYWLFMYRLANDTDYSHQVEVASSKMVFGTHDGNRMASVLGLLKNKATFPLDDLHLEVQFFDAEGELIDVGTHDGYSDTIPARGEAAFKIYVYASRPEEDYKSFKVFVRSAKDGTGFP